MDFHKGPTDIDPEPEPEPEEVDAMIFEGEWKAGSAELTENQPYCDFGEIATDLWTAVTAGKIIRLHIPYDETYYDYADMYLDCGVTEYYPSSGDPSPETIFTYISAVDNYDLPLVVVLTNGHYAYVLPK